MLFRRTLRNAERVNRILEAVIDEYQRTLNLTQELLQNATDTLDLTDDAKSSLTFIRNQILLLTPITDRIIPRLRRIPRFGRPIAAALTGITAGLRVAVNVLRTGISILRPVVMGFKKAVDELDPFVRLIDLQFQPINSDVNRVLWAARLLEPQQKVIEPRIPDAYKQRISQTLDQVEGTIARFEDLLLQLRGINSTISDLNRGISLLNAALSGVSINWRFAANIAQLVVAFASQVELLLGPILDALAALGSVVSRIFSPLQALLNRLLAPLIALNNKLRGLNQQINDRIDQFQTVVKKGFEALVKPFQDAAQFYIDAVRAALDLFLARLMEIARLIEQLLALLNGPADWKEAVELATPDNIAELVRIIEELIEELGLGDRGEEEEEAGGGVGFKQSAGIRALIDQAQAARIKLEGDILGKPLAPIEIGWLSRLSSISASLNRELLGLNRALPKKRGVTLSSTNGRRTVRRFMELSAGLQEVQGEITGLVAKTRSNLPRGYPQDLRRYLNRASLMEPVDLLATARKKKSKADPPLLTLDRRNFRYRLNLSPRDPRFDLARPFLEAAGFLPREAFPPSLVEKLGDRIEFKGKERRRGKRRAFTAPRGRRRS